MRARACRAPYPPRALKAFRFVTCLPEIRNIVSIRFLGAYIGARDAYRPPPINDAQRSTARASEQRAPRGLRRAAIYAMQMGDFAPRAV